MTLWSACDERMKTLRKQGAEVGVKTVEEDEFGPGHVEVSCSIKALRSFTQLQLTDGLD